MSNILKEINERIDKAEKDRDNALKELASIKKQLSSSGIYLRDGAIFMMANAGGGGWLCWNCPLFKHTSEDNGKCSVGRDCYIVGKGGRAYSLSEIRVGFQKHLQAERKGVGTVNVNKDLIAAIRKIADVVNKAVTKADQISQELNEEEKEST